MSSGVQILDRVQPTITQGVSWVRSANERNLAHKVGVYAAAFFAAALCILSLVGIPLVYRAMKEYGRQETEANGVTHPLTQKMNDLENGWVFFRRFLQDPVQVSSIIPSSAALTAEVLSKIAPADEEPRRYLEVGAGSGPFTKEILKKLRPQDQLDIVEIDPEFCGILRELTRDLPNVRVFEQSITDYHPEERYDAIISGLPVHALSAQIVEDALINYEALTKPDGTVSHFEYILLPKIKQKCLFGERGRDFDRLLAVKDRFIQSHQTETVKVWNNFPPARVLHFQIPA